jgi:hypothetical protein
VSCGLPQFLQWNITLKTGRVRFLPHPFLSAIINNNSTTGSYTDYSLEKSSLKIQESINSTKSRFKKWQANGCDLRK